MYEGIHEDTNQGESPIPPKVTSRRGFLETFFWGGLFLPFLNIERLVGSDPFKSIQKVLREISPQLCSEEVNSKRKSFRFLTYPQWVNLAKNSIEDAEKIQRAFYTTVYPLAVAHARYSGIPADIYMMIMEKESAFLASYPAQYGNNPLHINTTGNKLDFIGQHGTFKWMDRVTEYDMIQFTDLDDVFTSFDTLFHYWGTKKGFMNKSKTYLTKDECIKLFTAKDCWNSGASNTPEHFKTHYDKVVRDRKKYVK